MSGNKNLMLSDFNMFLFCTYFLCNNIMQYKKFIRKWFGFVLGAETIIFYGSDRKYNFKLCARLLFFGVTGVLLATIITIVLFNFLSRNRVLFKSYFQRTIKEYYIDHVFIFICYNCKLYF